MTIVISRHSNHNKENNHATPSELGPDAGPELDDDGETLTASEARFRVG